MKLKCDKRMMYIVIFFLLIMSIKVDSRGNQYTYISLCMKLEEDLETLSSVMAFFCISVIVSNRCHFYFSLEKSCLIHMNFPLN